MTLPPLISLVATQAQEQPGTFWGFATVVALQVGRIIQQAMLRRELVDRLDAQDTILDWLVGQLTRKGVVTPDVTSSNWRARR